MNCLSTRTEKFKKLREQLKLESLVIESSYVQSQSEQLLKHTKQLKNKIDDMSDLPLIYRKELKE